jgi:hypothetical protein
MRPKPAENEPVFATGVSGRFERKTARIAENFLDDQNQDYLYCIYPNISYNSTEELL